MASPQARYAPGQRWIESLMIDSCVVSREPLQQFSGTLDLKTGLRVLPNTATDPIVLYKGKCIFDRSKGEERPEELADEMLNLVKYEIFFPRSFTGARLRDMVTVTASRDPMIVGHVMRVLDVMANTHFVYRGVHAQDMTAARSLYERD